MKIIRASSGLRAGGVQGRRGAVVALALVAASLVSPACKRPGPGPAAPEETLVVFAAASLRDVFTAMADPFKRAHPGVEVTFSFAGTQELRAQIEQGATADVFASADQQHVDDLVRASRLSGPVVFARNEPVLIVSRESAATIRVFADLPAASRVVVGAPDVPIGRYTLRILDRASATLGADFRSRVEASIVSRELNVRQVLAKVSLGEAQAGVVYGTDARSARDRVVIVAIPPDINEIARYPIAVVAGTRRPGLARAWVDHALSPEGQRLLREAGFLPASGGGERGP